MTTNTLPTGDLITHADHDGDRVLADALRKIAADNGIEIPTLMASPLSIFHRLETAWEERGMHLTYAFSGGIMSTRYTIITSHLSGPCAKYFYGPIDLDTEDTDPPVCVHCGDKAPAVDTCACYCHSDIC